MRRAFRILLIVALFSATSPSAAVLGVNCSDQKVAAEGFASDQEIVFRIDETGSAHITQKVTLKNLIGGCRIPEYILNFNTKKVKNVSGRDSQGNLTVNLIASEQATKMVAKLNNEPDVKGKSVGFELNYSLEGLGEKLGLVWSVVVPKVISSEKVDSYHLKIVVPKSFGELFSISSEPEKIISQDDQTVLDFGTREQTPSYIFASFGRWQEISFRFKIPLKNNKPLPQKFSVSLPPDTEKQHVLIKKLEPLPERYILTEAGNYLAEYKVAGKKSLEVAVEGVVKIVGEGESFVEAPLLTKAQLSNYQKSSQFIHAQDRLVQERAKQLKTAEAIYKFVVEYLSYDEASLSTKKASRRGAANLLKAKEPATNLDFVDLFVSLARAAGIPAREVFGFVIGNDQSSRPSFVGEPLNTNRLHVWAQVYDLKKGLWVNADPTWAATSGLDYFKESLPDRMVLFFSESSEDIKNLSYAGLVAKELEVSGSSSRADFSPKAEIRLLADQVVAGFPVEIKVVVENKKGVSLRDVKFKITVSGADLIGEDTLTAPILFPFEKKNFKFKIRSSELFGMKKGVARVEVEAKSGEEKVRLSNQKEIEIKSFFSLGPQQAILILLIVLIIAGLVTPRLRR